MTGFQQYAHYRRSDKPGTSGKEAQA
jgi:hypothetical protein